MGEGASDKGAQVLEEGVEASATMQPNSACCLLLCGMLLDSGGQVRAMVAVVGKRGARPGLVRLRAGPRNNSMPRVHCQCDTTRTWILEQ